MVVPTLEVPRATDACGGACTPPSSLKGLMSLRMLPSLWPVHLSRRLLISSRLTQRTAAKSQPAPTPHTLRPL